MSKIEKALQRARDDRKLQIIAYDNADTQQLVTVPSNQLSNLEQRGSAAREIATMQEPQLRSNTELDQERIIYPEMDETGTVEAFREVRTKIVQRCGGQNCAIVVTSLNPKSGTSFVARNLGAAFAFDAGKTALVMDCNLHNPSFHRLVLGGEHKGITDYLENPEMDIADIICSVGIPRLRVIPAGANREASVEYFTSARMQQMMQVIKQRYQERYIILDSPPMSQSADLQILMDLCDYAILVVPYGRVTEAQLVDAVKTIGEKKLLGIVFNGEPRPPGRRPRKPSDRGES
jgi:protein-tyrosine kinase